MKTVAGFFVVLVFGAAGCGNVAEPSEGSEPRPGDAGRRDQPSNSAASRGASASVPTDMFERPTVWIGEIERIVTYPSSDEEPGAREKVTLVLDALASGVAGTVTFGEGPLPSPDPSDVYPIFDNREVWLSPFDEWSFSPFPGFPYSLVSSELFGNRLALGFAPTDIWEAWCVEQTVETEPRRCDCSGASCHARRGPLVRLDLLVDGDSMEGQFFESGIWVSGTPAIRLKRVQ